MVTSNRPFSKKALANRILVSFIDIGGCVKRKTFESLIGMLDGDEYKEEERKEG